jgi:iron(III) transport system substrate-binding protein
MGTAAVPSDKSFVPTGVTLAGAVVYNKSKVKTPPTSFAQLLTPAWKGKVGTNDPSQSGPTFPIIAGIMNAMGGVSGGEAYFTKLKANGLVINPTNGPTLQALTNGQINVALIQSSAGVGAALGSSKIGVEYLKPVTVLPSAIGIDAKADPTIQAEAKKFIDYVLSPAGQKVMQSGDPTGDSLYYPVVNGTQPLKGLPPVPASVTQNIDPYQWGQQEGTVNTWFDNNIVR